MRDAEPLTGMAAADRGCVEESVRQRGSRVWTASQIVDEMCVEIAGRHDR